MENSTYKKMYLILFNAVTDAIQNIDQKNYGKATEILVKGQQDAEDIFIETEE